MLIAWRIRVENTTCVARCTNTKLTNGYTQTPLPTRSTINPQQVIQQIEAMKLSFELSWTLRNGEANHFTTSAQEVHNTSVTNRSNGV